MSVDIKKSELTNAGGLAGPDSVGPTDDAEGGVLYTEGVPRVT